MNSDYVTALRVQQHHADLLGQARDHGLAVAARSSRPERAAPRWTARWWRRQSVPSRRPEVARA